LFFKVKIISHASALMYIRLPGNGSGAFGQGESWAVNLHGPRALEEIFCSEDNLAHQIEQMKQRRWRRW
jgi:hypothetical protein